MEMEADTGWTWPHTQGCLEPSEAGRGRNEPPLESVERAQPCPAWTSDVWSSGLVEDTFLLL